MADPNLADGGYVAEDGTYKPKGSSKKMQQTQAQVDEVVEIMKVNLDKVLERDQKLSSLDDRADALQEGAQQFEKQAATLKNKMFWKNMKMTIIIAVVVLIIIVVFFRSYIPTGAIASAASAAGNAASSSGEGEKGAGGAEAAPKEGAGAAPEKEHPGEHHGEKEEHKPPPPKEGHGGKPKHE